MIFFVALIPATMLTVAGYVVLYVAQRSEGSLKSFGRYLSFWAFTLAVLVVLGSLLAAARGGRMHGCMMHGAMMGGCGGEGMARQCPVMHSWRHEMPGMSEGMIEVMPGPATALPVPPPPAAAPGAPPPK